MRLALTAAALMLTWPVMGREIVRCAGKSHSPITITLDARRFAGRSLSCISGDFVTDLTPCAPADAFALSAPTGDAAIVGVVSGRQDYASHSGGVTSFVNTPEKLSFSGGFNDPEDGLTEDWTFDVDRVSGDGKLSLKGKAEAVFKCTKATPKL